MSTIEIVSHCWGGDLPIYPHLLRAQGLSLLKHSQHQCEVVWTICYHDQDKSVIAVLDELEEALLARHVAIRRFVLPLGSLFERAIGRNAAAITTEADTVWFTDCDYLFSGNCLDSAIGASAAYSDCVVYPQQVAVTSHGDGDHIISEMEEKRELAAGILSLFDSRTEFKAIGGIQIVTGDLARSRGYLNEWMKWLKPITDTSRGQFSTRSDVKFRSYIGKTVPVSFLGTCRVRHSRRSYGGTVID